MDGDPSSPPRGDEDRIRLIGRLFLTISGRGPNPRSLSYFEVFSFMQNFGQLCRFLWAKSWTLGQNRGQKTRDIPIPNSNYNDWNLIEVRAILMSPAECCWALTKSYPYCLFARSLSLPATIYAFVDSAEIFWSATANVINGFVWFTGWHPPNNFSDSLGFFAYRTSFVPESPFGLRIIKMSFWGESPTNVHSRIVTNFLCPVTNLTRNLIHGDSSVAQWS